MNDATILNRQRVRAAERAASGVQYTAKDFQLEVLDRLEEMQGLAAGLEESWNKKLEAVKEQRLLKFDSRTLIAMAAIALSIAGFVVQDARNNRIRIWSRPRRGCCDWSRSLPRTPKAGSGLRFSWAS
ncbi:MAG: hypothetical protein WCF26_23090 [Candidatus Sulfotelmatobacter sp.]